MVGSAILLTRTNSAAEMYLTLPKVRVDAMFVSMATGMSQNSEQINEDWLAFTPGDWYVQNLALILLIVHVNVVSYL